MVIVSVVVICLWLVVVLYIFVRLSYVAQYRRRILLRQSEFCKLPWEEQCEVLKRYTRLPSFDAMVFRNPFRWQWDEWLDGTRRSKETSE